MAKPQSTKKPSSDRQNKQGQVMTTDQGVPISDDQNSLKVAERGATLLEDFILREKITHFDHERIPERVVHARGVAAHGVFQAYKNCSALTKAHFLSDPSAKTPVFVRFSTVAGSRGSADTARDVRGFAVKFYTQEGNYDLVGNNIPVFFIQDAIKFPDLIHAAKPEPHNEIPQAQTAHDTFWDFAGQTTETTHMLMWIMSDRAIPRSLAMMEGFGVHTFRLINAKGEGRLVKFHWKPLLGTHGLVWDEAQKLAGKDPDFHRRDLFEAIERGDFPEWELGVQVVEEKDEHAFDFDLLDPTKLIPEELVPITPLGKMTLNRNPDNYFAETEQVAFCAAHVVPGIDFTNDPLLQGRLFSYTDTQISRLGGPNFHEIPINRPVCPFSNNQRDGLHRQTIDQGNVAYGKNSLQDNHPRETGAGKGFESYSERVDGRKVRVRSPSFADHYSQATLFWESQTPIEKTHIIDSFSFELSKCEVKEVREKMLQNLAQVHPDLVKAIAAQLGMPVPPKLKDAPASKKGTGKKSVTRSPALSMIHPEKDDQIGAKARKVAILVADGVDGKQVTELKAGLEKSGITVVLVAPKLGPIVGLPGLTPQGTLKGMPSILFDAVLVAGGARSIEKLMGLGDALHYLMEAYIHRKTLGIDSTASPLLDAAHLSSQAEGVILLNSGPATLKIFIRALSRHRHWNRPDADAIPA
jgi:catalase